MNTDIERLKELLHDCQYNPQIVSRDGVNKVFDWLRKKYDIDIGNNS